MFSIFKEPFGHTEKNINLKDSAFNQESSDTRTTNLRVDHFNFFNNSQAKQSRINKNLSQYLPSSNNHSKLVCKGANSFRSRDEKKSVLQLQNHNLVFMNPPNTHAMIDRKHNRSALKSKIFTLQPDSTVLDDECKVAKNQKLSYLKRYVANFNKNGQSQFDDGYWGNHPNGEIAKNLSNQSKTPGLDSKLSRNNDKTPTNTFGNYLPYNPNQASFNPSFKERELSIIDLQLPIKSNNCSFAQSSLSRIKKSEFYTNDENNNKFKSLKNSQSNSSILIENMDYSNAVSRINAYQDPQNQVDSVTQNTVIPEIDDLIKFKSKDRSNTFLNKYLISQQKKKHLSGSSNRLFEANFPLNKLAPFKSQTLISGSNESNITYSTNAKNEIIANSSLKNLSSNSLLIKRLKF